MSGRASKVKGSSDKERRVLSWLPDYDISFDGEVRRITPAITRGAVPYVVHGTRTTPYRLVKLTLPNASKRAFLVSRLVCEAFNGPQPPDRPHCAHIDGDSRNNTADNLYWATVQENVGRDRIRHGRTPRGSRNGKAKLDEATILEIRKNFTGRHGEVAKIAREYGLSHSGMHSAIHGRNWRYV